MLKDCLREKFPLKSEADIAKQLKLMTGGKTRIDEQVWQKIIQKLYPHGCSEVQDRLHNLVEKRREQCTLEYTKNHTQRKLTREQQLSFQHMIREESRLYYPELEQCILAYSLQMQEQFLHRLNNVFTRVDSD